MGFSLVLCIDDLPQVWDLRRATLESQGCWVEVASNGQATMKMLEEVSVAAVLLEYKLGGHGPGSRGLSDQATVSQPADRHALRVLQDA